MNQKCFPKLLLNNVILLQIITRTKVQCLISSLCHKSNLIVPSPPHKETWSDYRGHHFQCSSWNGELMEKKAPKSLYSNSSAADKPNSKDVHKSGRI